MDNKTHFLDENIKSLFITLTIVSVLLIPILLWFVGAIFLLIALLSQLNKSKINFLELTRNEGIVVSLISFAFAFVPMPSFFDWAWVISNKIWLFIRYGLVLILALINSNFVLKKFERENYYLVWSSFVIYCLTLLIGSLIMLLMGYRPASP